MNLTHLAPISVAVALIAWSSFSLFGCNGGEGDAVAADDTPQSSALGSLVGDRVSALTFGNPYAHVPAQCYIETSAGTQNACQYCHTNGVYEAGLGNNPQAGAAHNIGNLQTPESVFPRDYTSPSILGAHILSTTDCELTS